MLVVIPRGCRVDQFPHCLPEDLVLSLVRSEFQCIPHLEASAERMFNMFLIAIRLFFPLHTPRC